VKGGPLTDAEQDAGTAYHEAGHFVIGNVFGLRDHWLTIEPHGDSLGGVFGEYPLRDGATLEEVDQVVISYYAGVATEAQLDPSSADRAREHGGGDDEQAEHFLGLAYPDGVTDEHRRRLRGRTARLVEEHWAEIDRLAQELIGRRRMGFDEAELILGIVRGEEGATEEDLARYRAFKDKPGIRV
jgi:hypothetical protein